MNTHILVLSIIAVFYLVQLYCRFKKADSLRCVNRLANHVPLMFLILSFYAYLNNIGDFYNDSMQHGLPSPNGYCDALVTIAELSKQLLHYAILSFFLNIVLQCVSNKAGSEK